MIMNEDSIDIDIDINDFCSSSSLLDSTTTSPTKLSSLPPSATTDASILHKREVIHVGELWMVARNDLTALRKEHVLLQEREKVLQSQLSAAATEKAEICASHSSRERALIEECTNALESLRTVQAARIKAEELSNSLANEIKLVKENYSSQESIANDAIKRADETEARLKDMEEKATRKQTTCDEIIALLSRKITVLETALDKALNVSNNQKHVCEKEHIESDMGTRKRMQYKDFLQGALWYAARNGRGLHDEYGNDYVEEAIEEDNVQMNTLREDLVKGMLNDASLHALLSTPPSSSRLIYSDNDADYDEHFYDKFIKEKPLHRRNVRWDDKADINLDREY